MNPFPTFEQALAATIAGDARVIDQWLQNSQAANLNISFNVIHLLRMAAEHDQPAVFEQLIPFSQNVPDITYDCMFYKRPHLLDLVEAAHSDALSPLVLSKTLLTAAELGDFPTVKWLTDRLGADLKTGPLTVALGRAIHCNYVDVVEHLLALPQCDPKEDYSYAFRQTFSLKDRRLFDLLAPLSDLSACFRHFLDDLQDWGAADHMAHLVTSEDHRYAAEGHGDLRYMPQTQSLMAEEAAKALEHHIPLARVNLSAPPPKSRM